MLPQNKLSFYMIYRKLSVKQKYWYFITSLFQISQMAYFSLPLFCRQQKLRFQALPKYFKAQMDVWFHQYHIPPLVSVML